MVEGRRTGGLLAVHAHPDDETLSTGGLLATWASLGRPTTVVTCTRGEQGEVIPTELAHLAGDRDALALYREGELAAALAALDVVDHHYLDQLPGPSGPDDAALAPAASDARYRDSGMVWTAAGQAGRGVNLPDGAFVTVPVDEAAQRLARLIRERRPDVVVTYEPGGGYGHPDHVHTHLVTMRALELAEATADGPRAASPAQRAEAFRVPVVLWAAAPEPAIRTARGSMAGRPWVAALLEADPRLRLPDPSQASSMAVAASEVDLVVDVSAVASAVAAALRAHATQIHAVALAPEVPVPVDAVAVLGCAALSDHVLLPLLDREWYRIAIGWEPPRGTDLFPLVPQVA